MKPLPRNQANSAAKSPVLPMRAEKVFGLRERNKRDKLRRIKDAATELFLQKGFDDTTTRAIALKAGVGLGTVFVYAPTKRDLLFLIINDELQAEVDRAASLVQETRTMLENLMRIFRAHYRYYCRRPTLSRLALREMMFYAAGAQAEKFLSTRERLIALIESVVTLAIDKKEIAPREDTKLVAWVIFSIYQIEIRHWLSTDDLDVGKGVDFLKRQLILLVEGLSPPQAG
jgi:AcrR family transcriptional regulator